MSKYIKVHGNIPGERITSGWTMPAHDLVHNNVHFYFYF